MRTLYSWISQFVDPFRAVNALFSLGWYLRDWRKYSRLSGAEACRLIDSSPELHDRTKITSIDQHYFHANGWAMRRILAQHPIEHLDVASQTMFVNLLSSVVPVTFLDYRMLKVRLEGLKSCCGDILSLPFADNSVKSLSCLHVAEHIGLGRYGDRLSPCGTKQACAELRRILAEDGNLYFVVPIGIPRTCFNAHRIHSPKTIMGYFAGLELMEFSGVHDDGRFVERAGLDEFTNSLYACGMFWFRKSGKIK